MDESVSFRGSLAGGEDRCCAEHLEAPKRAHFVVDVKVFFNPGKRLGMENLHGVPEGVIRNIPLDRERNSRRPELREGLDRD